MWANSSSSSSSSSSSCCILKRLSKRRRNIRVRRLHRVRKFRKGASTGIKTGMEMKNLELYLKNQIIIEENQRLRKKALLLHQENRTLLAQLQSKFSDKNHEISTPWDGIYSLR